jgi:hypothetical protein
MASDQRETDVSRSLLLAVGWIMLILGTWKFIALVIIFFRWALR